MQVRLKLEDSCNKKCCVGESKKKSKTSHLHSGLLRFPQIWISRINRKTNLNSYQNDHVS